MAETPNERTQEAISDLAAAARDRGVEKLEGVKGQLAEGAERVAAGVERAADELEGEGDDTISGFGRSAATLMRQLAGGIRERDVEAFARELGALARRNPGVFLAGSVALGFGIARFFKARVPHSRPADDYGRQSTGGWQESGETSGWQGSEVGERERNGIYSEESLDLSTAAASEERGQRSSKAEGGLPSGDGSQSGSYGTGAAQATGATQQSLGGDEDRNQPKSRQSGKQKAKSQRASAGGAQRAGEGSSGPSNDRPSTEAGGETAGSTDSAFTGGTGGGTLRGGKS